MGFTVSTENGSQSCEDGRFHDGDVDITLSRVGFLNDLIVFTKKDILLADKKHCRQRPYNDLLMEKNSLNQSTIPAKGLVMCLIKLLNNAMHLS